MEVKFPVPAADCAALTSMPSARQSGSCTRAEQEAGLGPSARPPVA
jgi:hypothetical protein